MNVFRNNITFVFVVLVFTVLPAAAHHSHQNFIRAEYLVMEGTVREIHWLNPHSWVYLEVLGSNDEPDLWVLEGAAARTLFRKGWTTEMVQVGDDISVRCHPLKDGSSGCLLGYITNEAGVEKEFD
ncbi:MAG: DUF6152 family protein [Candidatus Rariloculaceae bacterium]|mgnify:CR=1 FL=1